MKGLVIDQAAGLVDDDGCEDSPASKSEPVHEGGREDGIHGGGAAANAMRLQALLLSIH
jgi:hypothetical protein